MPAWTADQIAGLAFGVSKHTQTPFSPFASRIGFCAQGLMLLFVGGAGQVDAQVSKAVLICLARVQRVSSLLPSPHPRLRELSGGSWGCARHVAG